ncbi:hypothetical protein LIER_17026 [Lithospermum erythrorhizon]|uniref:Uncharacterized protein n=1 Tax=Lithospermum erythrorhizon TaxID=34254 RepID=A0AAV3QE72_LITER
MKHQISAKSGSPRQIEEAKYVESDAQVEEVAAIEPAMRVSDDIYSENGAASQRKHEKIVVQAANVELIPSCKSVMHTPNASFTNSFNSSVDLDKVSCTENKELVLVLDHNVSETARKVNAFLKDVEDLKQKIDNIDSTTLARIAASPATKTFLQYQVKHHTFSPLPMFDLVEPVDIQDPSYEHVEDLGGDGNKKDPTKNRRDQTCWADLENDNDLLSMELEGQVTSKVSDNGHLITVLSKLCYEQVSKQKAWSTTVQIAQLGEGPGIVKTTLLQFKDKRRITETRGQGLPFPFDDHG